MIKKIFSYYWQMSLLKESPENSPYSIILMSFSFVLLTLVMVFQWYISETEVSDGLPIIVLSVLSVVLSIIAYTFLILFFTGFAARLVQTVTCLFCAHIIVHAFATPLFMLDPYLAHANLKNPLFLFIGMIYLFITLSLSVWQFVITAHIYKYALGTTAVQSALAAFGLIAANILTLTFWR